MLCLVYSAARRRLQENNATTVKKVVDHASRACYMCSMRKRIERVIWELGGNVEAAKAVGAHRATVHRWVQQDRIPAKWQSKVLEAAQEVGARVVAEDLIG